MQAVDIWKRATACDAIKNLNGALEFIGRVSDILHLSNKKGSTRLMRNLITDLDIRIFLEPIVTYLS